MKTSTLLRRVLKLFEKKEHWHKGDMGAIRVVDLKTAIAANKDYLDAEVVKDFWKAANSAIPYGPGDIASLDAGACDPRANCWCLDGGAEKVLCKAGLKEGSAPFKEHKGRFVTALGFEDVGEVWAWNDDDKRTIGQVRNLLRKSLRQAERAKD